MDEFDLEGKADSKKTVIKIEDLELSLIHI